MITIRAKLLIGTRGELIVLQDILKQQPEKNAETIKKIEDLRLRADRAIAENAHKNLGQWDEIEFDGTWDELCDIRSECDKKINDMLKK